MLKNAIVVMFDTLQYNYVGCYGNDWIKTPHMDRLAREGVLFENCYTEGLPTVPCRRAMLTGRYTLPVAGWVGLSTEDTTIADLCWGRPIDAALIFDCPNFRLPKFGYTRGFDKVWFTHGHEGDYFYDFDELIHLDPKNFYDADSAKAYEKKMGEAACKGVITELTTFLRQRQTWKDKTDHIVWQTVSNAIDYLERVDRNKQFFLWVDSFDPHEPWYPPSVTEGRPCPYDPDYKGKPEPYPFEGLVDGVYTEAQLNHIRMLYAETVTLCDECLGRLLDAVRRLGLENDTLFMMVSDHGEPLGNGQHGHGLMEKVRPWPYEELAHTPMLLRAPGIKPGQRIKAFVQSCDVAPTVCDWLGIGVHPKMQGKSLLPLARGEVKKVRNFAIAGYHGYGWAIFTEDWSYIHWLQPENKDNESMGASFYSEGVDTGYLKEVGGKGYMDEWVEGFAQAKEADVESGLPKREHPIMALDGADQWTCAPNSTTEVPESDELYDRRQDPFQLNNVIDQHPDVAHDLLLLLSDYMEELRQS